MVHIVTDSTSSITPEEAQKLGIDIVPLTIFFGDESYKDSITLTSEAFYEKLTQSRELPRSSQPAPELFAEVFRKYTDDVLVITISSKMSGTINSAYTAKTGGHFSNICIYDSLATGATLKLMVLAACQNRDKSIAELIALLDDLRPRIHMYAAVDTLLYLHRGGRLSKSVSVLGALLDIKPIMMLSREGKPEMCSKQRGSAKAVAFLRDFLAKKKIDEHYPFIYLYSKEKLGCARLVKDTQELVHGLVTECINICPVLGTHVGPGIFGFAFVEA